MFNKKELAILHAKLQQLEEKHDARTQDLKNHTERFCTEIQAQLKQIQEKQFYYFEEFERNIAAFRDMNITYQKSVEELNILKNNLTEKALTKIEKDFKTELDKHLGNFTLEHAKFQELHAALEMVKIELQRLTFLGQHIKATDFEITQYLKQYQEQQQEKSKLLNQVDSLQSLIAKIRRGDHR